MFQTISLNYVYSVYHPIVKKTTRYTKSEKGID